MSSQLIEDYLGEVACFLSTHNKLITKLEESIKKCEEPCYVVKDLAKKIKKLKHSFDPFYGLTLAYFIKMNNPEASLQDHLHELYKDDENPSPNPVKKETFVKIVKKRKRDNEREEECDYN